jgi:hypothetical protein
MTTDDQRPTAHDRGERGNTRRQTQRLEDKTLIINGFNRGFLTGIRSAPMQLTHYYLNFFSLLWTINLKILTWICYRWIFYLKRFRNMNYPSIDFSVLMEKL